MRVGAFVAAAGVLACLVLAPPVGAAPGDAGATLDVDPPAAVALAVVEASGSCPPEEPEPEPSPETTPPDEGEIQGPPLQNVPGAAQPPPGTDLYFDGDPIGLPVTLTGGSFTGADLQVPRTASPGDHTITSRCGGAFDFQVLAAPTLEVTPDEAVRGQTVLASGTCEATVEETSVALDGTEGEVVLPEAGRIVDVPVRIPDDASEGDHDVTTSCGGADVVVVVVTVPPQSPEPSEPSDATVGPEPSEPPDELVLVPNLTGLTEEQAVTVLTAARLTLGNPDAGRGRVVGQDPAPGTSVPPGSPVRIELDVSEPRAWSPLALAGGGGALLFVGAPVALRFRRLRKEHRWLDERVAVVPGRPDRLATAAPPGRVPGLDVRIEVDHDNVTVRGGTPDD